MQMRIIVLLLLLASVLGRFAHGECVSEPQAAVEHGHPASHSGHAPQHRHEAPSECTMVGSCATIAAPANQQIFDIAVAIDMQGGVRLHHDYRDPHLTRPEPPPRYHA